MFAINNVFFFMFSALSYNETIKKIVDNRHWYNISDIGTTSGALHRKSKNFFLLINYYNYLFVTLHLPSKKKKKKVILT